jgi:hypothetical protein
MQHYITFTVASVSENTNAFGLRGHILVSRTGLACELGLNHLNSRARGSRVRVPIFRHDLRGTGGHAHAAARWLHGEIPRALPKCPAAVVKEINSLPVPV